jgi:hypothetical protein
MADTQATPTQSAAPRAAGVPTEFTPTQYDIKQYSYPSDLYSNNQVYGGNYVIFYINVAEDSRVLKVNKEPTVDASLVPARMQGDLTANNYNGAQTVAGIAGPSAVPLAAAGALAGATAVPGKIASSLAEKAKMAGGIKNVSRSSRIFTAGRIAATSVVGGAMAGAAGPLLAGGIGATAVGALTGGKLTKQQKRLKKAIALHVPNQLSIRYQMDWSAEETSAYQMAATGGTELVKAMTSGNLTNASGTVNAIVASLALSKGPQAAALSAQSGLAANPKKENLFKSVEFRTFSLDYKFFPRNSAEAKNVLSIIKEFKLHMHPEYKDTNNFVFIYPSEFDIFYYNNGKENLNLHRHTSCVLTDMNVNYTPNGMFNAFADGMPTQIDVTLSFKELAILTKKQIEENY